MTTTTLPTQQSAAAAPYARAFREALVAGLMAFACFSLLIGLKTDQNIRNELVLVQRWGLLAIVIAITMVGRFCFVAYLLPFMARQKTVDTTTAQAFALKRGVCQDFSHVMITALRSLGIPAGYVSGYLRTLPPPGKERLEGADAMHAWVRIWCGGLAGWVEYDPTNDIQAGTDHIVVGYGRDYADVAPVIGALKSYGRQQTLQAVDVIPVEA